MLRLRTNKIKKREAVGCLLHLYLCIIEALFAVTVAVYCHDYYYFKKHNVRHYPHVVCYIYST